MKIERRKTRLAEVYTASLNDIMFFLLLFFLIISTMVTPVALKVMLPHSSTAEKVITKKNIMLAVTADRQYFIGECGDRVRRLAAGRHVAEPTAGRRSDRYSEPASVEDVAVRREKIAG